MSRSSIRRIFWGFLICLVVFSGFLSTGTSSRAADEDYTSLLPPRSDAPAGADSLGTPTTETGDPDNIEPTLPDWIRDLVKELFELL